MDYNISKLDFTIKSEEEFYETVDVGNFIDEDAELIYEHLHNKMKIIPFGDYLKRYIFKKADFTGDINDVSLKEYQEIIISSFAENNTPKSFEPTSSKLSALTKNWLTQTAVKRQTIFLLGFGLNMSVYDVSKFLTNAQGERDFNFKNPFEVICWYCYKNGYKFPKFTQLMEAYEELPYAEKIAFDDATVGIRDLFYSIETEGGLMKRLAEIKFENNGKLFSVSAKRSFDALYEKVRNIIATEYNREEKDKAKRVAGEYLESQGESMAFSYEVKREKYNRILSGAKIYSADDISEADVEKYLCCGIPFDGKGNLLKFSKSTLYGHLSNKRMSRQHIHEILSEKTEVDRFDLITLCFFVHAMSESVQNSKTRYIEFVDDINSILVNCCMGELYVANPYECFLLMCTLSEWPMGAYSDVFEMSYEE